VSSDTVASGTVVLTNPPEKVFKLLLYAMSVAAQRLDDVKWIKVTPFHQKTVEAANPTQHTHMLLEWIQWYISESNCSVKIALTWAKLCTSNNLKVIYKQRAVKNSREGFVIGKSQKGVQY